MTTDACDVWSVDGCEGTPLCPPRCPRFVDREGRAYLVRPLDDGELDALVRMYREYPREHRSMGVPPGDEGAIRDWLERLHRRGSNFVAWDGDSAVGHSGYSPDGGETPEFLVYVHPDYHGRGLGTELTKHAIAHAAEADHDALRLHVARSNATAIGVYERLGFERVADHALELEMGLSMDDPVAMEVRLPPAARA